MSQAIADLQVERGLEGGVGGGGGGGGWGEEEGGRAGRDFCFIAKRDWGGEWGSGGWVAHGESRERFLFHSKGRLGWRVGVGWVGGTW